MRVELFSLDGHRAFERNADLEATPTTIALPARALKGTFLLRTSVDGREESRRITLF